MPRSCSVREKPSGARRRRGFAAGNHPPGATKFAGDHTARDHPFPSRTRKLSLAGPMVLHRRLCGRLGDRRQLIRYKGRAQCAAFVRSRAFAAPGCCAIDPAICKKREPAGPRSGICICISLRPRPEPQAGRPVPLLPQSLRPSVPGPDPPSWYALRAGSPDPRQRSVSDSVRPRARQGDP